MPYLKQLKIVPIPQRNNDPKIGRRQRLIEQLTEQLEMAQAALKGEHYAKFYQKWVRKENGERVLINQPKRLRAWWQEDAAGNCVIALRYANKPLELDKGKAAIEVGPKAKLPEVINILISAVNGGELDDLLEQKSKQRGQEIGRK